METTTKTTKQQNVFNYFLSLNSNYEFFKNYEHIFTYKKDSFFIVAIFNKKATKPNLHYKFYSEVERDQYINKYKVKTLERLKEIEFYKMERLKEAEKYQKGEILVSSWGYEQTNIDFYIILERKNKTLTLQELGKNKEYSSVTMSGTCTPNKNIFKGEAFKKRISDNGSINLSSYKYCSLYDGKPKDFTCYA